MASSKQQNVKYKCPFCDKRMTKINLVEHVGDIHEDMLPEGFTPLRYVFNYVNRKSPSYHGRCVICKKDTEWDENKGRYNRLCGSEACKKEYIKRFEDNMNRTKGTTRISQTAEGQAQMLANRKISGTYTFQNGVKKTYTGSYELNALKFMDQVMNINPDDIMCPGPILEYTYEGKKHMYITDFYYVPYNLIIEVKDGGKNPNKRNMPEYRGKQIAKEEFIINETDFNYLRLTDNDMSQLLAVFMDLKMQLVDETMDRVVHVNEAMTALTTGYIPGFRDTGSVYIVNNMQNMVFCGVTDSPKLDSVFYHRNKEGYFVKESFSTLPKVGTDWNIYATDISIEDAIKKLSPARDKKVSENFVYNILFEKEVYGDINDQLRATLERVPTMEEFRNITETATRNFINYDPNGIEKITNELEKMKGEIYNV